MRARGSSPTIPMSPIEMVMVPMSLGSLAAAIATAQPPMLWPASAIRAGSMFSRLATSGVRRYATTALVSCGTWAKWKAPGLPRRRDS